MGPPKNLQSGIIRILRGILANREKQDLRNMTDKRESLVKTEGKTIVFAKERYYLHSGTFMFAFWTIFCSKMGVPRGPLFCIFMSFSGSFFLYFFEGPFRAARKPKELISGPPGGRNSSSRLHAVLYFRNSSFSWKVSPRGGVGCFLGRFWGSFLDTFLFFCTFVFQAIFGTPAGTANNCFFGGSVVIWRRFIGSGAWGQNSSPSPTFA